MRIGIIRFSSLGDIVLTSPAVRGVRRTFPDAEIVYITTPLYRGLATMLPGVDHVETTAKPAGRFEHDAGLLAEKKWDRIADLQGSLRSEQLRKKLRTATELTDKPPRLRRSLLILTKIRTGRFIPVPLRQLELLGSWGVEDDGEGLELRPPDSMVERVVEKWSLLKHRPVVFVPGARHATKRWPEKYWAELFSRISRTFPVVIVGSKGETPPQLAKSVSLSSRALDLTGATNLTETVAVISNAGLLISGDTGPMHLAAALKTPLIAMFGPTVREFGFFPFRVKNSLVLERELWCRPCSAHGGRICPLLHRNCLRMIRPEEVAGEAERLYHEARTEEETD